jgi:hypothetical protein
MAGNNRRAVRPRDRIMSHLRVVGEITDARGMASTTLAAAVGYPGSSVAFAQLLSGMERAGLIEREIRGKRTYRIGLVPAASEPATGHAEPELVREGPARPAVVGAGLADVPDDATARDLAAAGGAIEGFDYDELARRLLAEVVRRLALAQTASPAAAAFPAGTSPAGPGPAVVSPAAAEGEPGSASPGAELAMTVASLERRLASIQSRQRKLTAENVRLREQLTAAQQSLAEARERADAQAGRLDAAERQMLERLLSSLRTEPARQESAGAG